MSTRMKEMERRAMADTKVIVIPEGKICDYIDGKFVMTHLKNMCVKLSKSG